MAMARVDPDRALEIALKEPNDKDFYYGLNDLSWLAHRLWDQKDRNEDDLD